jgi:hypothetical protein
VPDPRASGARRHRRRASHRPVARRSGRWLMPGRTDSAPRLNRHRIISSINASRGRLTSPISLGGENSCLGLSSGPSEVGRVTPARARRAIPANSPGALNTKSAIDHH